jgi:ABC-2 type transport system ATP-binding protein
MIEINGLSKSYGNHPVLNGIQLTFRRGEVHGIMGENGAGKTTLFNCIAGLTSYTGSIAYDRGLLKNELGYLPTELFFFSKMTGEEYLQLLCNARDIKYNNLKDNNLFELPLKQYAETYSTGMQKKLAITGLLLQKNEVFILDEPFNGVDIHSNLIIQEILRKLKELNKIVLMSSHIFSTLHDSCDYLHLLKEGRITQSVSKGNFEQIESEMKHEGIGNKVADILMRLT